MTDGDYRAKTQGISVVNGVEVDVTVRGDEERAEKVLMELKDRLGRVAEAYEEQTPPSQLEERKLENTPPMRVAWDRIFASEVGDE